MGLKVLDLLLQLCNLSKPQVGIAHCALAPKKMVCKEQALQRGMCVHGLGFGVTGFLGFGVLGFEVQGFGVLGFWGLGLTFAVPMSGLDSMITIQVGALKISLSLAETQPEGVLVVFWRWLFAKRNFPPTWRFL